MFIFNWFTKPFLRSHKHGPDTHHHIEHTPTALEIYQEQRQAKLDLAYSLVGQFFVNKYLRQMNSNGRAQTLKNMRKQGIPLDVSLKIIEVKDHFEAGVVQNLSHGMSIEAS